MLKCDRAPKQCQNCIKRGHDFPGYADEVDFLFRSQNNVAQKQVERRVAAKILQRSVLVQQKNDETELATRQNSCSDKVVCVTPWSSRSHNQSDIPRPELSLAADIDEHALAFFSSNFLMAGSMSYVPPRANTGAASYRLLRGTMESAMKAVSLAAMSTFTGSAQLAEEARKRYGSAVAKTNAALARPDLAQDDHVLSTVLALNAFESLGGPDAQSLADWSKHAFGAAALVQLRGVSQFSSPVGQPMLISAVALTMVACSRDCKPFPAGLRDLMEQARTCATSYRDYWDYLLVKIRFTELWVTFMKKWPLCNDPIELEAAISRSLEVDEDIVHVCDNVPTSMRYSTFYEPDLAEFCLDGRCDTYRNHLAAQMWNGESTNLLVSHT